MTQPHVGDAFVGLHVDASDMDEEVREALDDLANDSDKQLQATGKEMGDDLVDGMAGQVEKTAGKEIGDSIDKSLKKTKVTTKVKVEYDSEGKPGKRIVETITTEIQDALADAGRPGGPLSRVGSGIADAIGAGFNVSGRSPLIALLIPLIGAIIGLVVAALQAVSALLALLGTIPALLLAIGLQVGVTVIAFQGLGTAIQGAFAAKNAKELNEALKNLTPSAQKFVREVLSIKDEFKEIQKIVQENFFKGMEGSVTRIVKALLPLLGPGLGKLATAMGEFFGQLAGLFASPSFVKLVDNVFPSTIKFLRQFGPQFVTFLTGLVDIAVASMPFLRRFGEQFGGIFEHIGEWLSEMAQNPEFQQWLLDMSNTIDDIIELFFTAMDFVKTFLDELNKAGGAKIIETLSDALSKLIFFLQSPAGKKAMEGLVDFSIIAIKVVTGILILILLIIGVFEFVGEKINEAIDSLEKFFTETVPGWFEDLFNFLNPVPIRIVGLFQGIGTKIAVQFIPMVPGIAATFARVLNDIRSWPGRIINQLGYTGNLLFKAGVNLINGLIAGIKYAAAAFLPNAMAAVAQRAKDFWPLSPAKEGPLRGKGDPFNLGRNFINRIAEGMLVELPVLTGAQVEATSNIFVGPGAINLGFQGALPTATQATGIGAAAGNGFMDQLAVRNARLAVRSI